MIAHSEEPERLTEVVQGQVRRDVTGRARMTSILKRIEAALERAIATLPDEDRRIMRMYYLDGYQVSRIAEALGVDQRPLYDRLDRALAQVHRVLVTDGVTAHEVRELLR